MRDHVTSRKPAANGWHTVQRLQDLQLDHDLRFDVVRYLYTNGEASPSVMVKSPEVGATSLPLVSYHTRILRDADVLEVVREVPVRGAVEHVLVLAPWARAVLDSILNVASPDKPITMKAKR